MPPGRTRANLRELTALRSAADEAKRKPAKHLLHPANSSPNPPARSATLPVRRIAPANTPPAALPRESPRTNRAAIRRRESQTQAGRTPPPTLKPSAPECSPTAATAPPPPLPSNTESSTPRTLRAIRRSAARSFPSDASLPRTRRQAVPPRYTRVEYSELGHESSHVRRAWPPGRAKASLRADPYLSVMTRHP